MWLNHISRAMLFKLLRNQQSALPAQCAALTDLRLDLLEGATSSSLAGCGAWLLVAARLHAASQHKVRHAMLIMRCENEPLVGS
jgi:hypothetical protein